MTEDEFAVELTVALAGSSLGDNCSAFGLNSRPGLLPRQGECVQVELDGDVFNLHIEQVASRGQLPVEPDRLEDR